MITLIFKISYSYVLSQTSCYWVLRSKTSVLNHIYRNISLLLPFGRREVLHTCVWHGGSFTGEPWPEGTSPVFQGSVCGLLCNGTNFLNNCIFSSIASLSSNIKHAYACFLPKLYIFHFFLLPLYFFSIVLHWVIASNLEIPFAIHVSLLLSVIVLGWLAGHQVEPLSRNSASGKWCIMTEEKVGFSVECVQVGTWPHRGIN